MPNWSWWQLLLCDDDDDGDDDDNGVDDDDVDACDGDVYEEVAVNMMSML